jgi:hypothetical protein
LFFDAIPHDHREFFSGLKNFFQMATDGRKVAMKAIIFSGMGSAGGSVLQAWLFASDIAEGKGAVCSWGSAWRCGATQATVWRPYR